METSNNTQTIKCFLTNLKRNFELNKYFEISVWAGGFINSEWVIPIVGSIVELEDERVICDEKNENFYYSGESPESGLWSITTFKISKSDLNVLPGTLKEAMIRVAKVKKSEIIEFSALNWISR